MKNTVIHHSADYDGIFCREIARKFLPDAELIGWDFKDEPLRWPDADNIYVMDLPLDRPFGVSWDRDIHDIRFMKGNVVWIDHHKSSIASHPTNIPGYRIDGVAACRLAWQWFTCPHNTPPREPLFRQSRPLPSKQDFLDRKVSEPLAVRLAGEYDVWDHRGDGDLEFQFGLDCQARVAWNVLLAADSANAQDRDDSRNEALRIVRDGKAAMACYAKRDADIVRERSFLVEFEGLKFLALNTARCNSNTFAARDVPETGHDALMGFYFNGRKWTVSLYHAQHRKDLDLSVIAVKHGGGGHRGACGFTSVSFPL